MQSQEEIQAKADQLTAREGKKVIPLVFEDRESKEQIVGYLRNPDRLTKTRILDKMMSIGMVTAASELLDIALLKEDSNPRISSAREEDDEIYLGAAMACFDFIKASDNLYKKK
ncbi:MAG: hypothetical protein NVS9B7_30310 [Flavisolibacter sp.]